MLEESRARRAFVPLLVREDLSWDEVARVAVHSPELQGAVLDSGLLRDYPEGSVLAHVLGYVGAANPADQAADEDPLLQLPEFRIGKSGIEHSYDRVLRGRAGLSRVEVNATGREIRELDRREGIPGADVRLALDLDLQRFCVARLSSELSASAVVVDVRSGGVLALASVPSYEPAAFTGGLRPSVWNELRDDPRTPLVNKCIRGQYPPGSTFKMMTALAALDAGITPSYQAFCPGHLSLGRPCSIAGGSTATARSRWSRPLASPATSISTILPAGSVSTRSPPWRPGSGSAGSSGSICPANSQG